MSSHRNYGFPSRNRPNPDSDDLEGRLRGLSLNSPRQATTSLCSQLIKHHGGAHGRHNGTNHSSASSSRLTPSRRNTTFGAPNHRRELDDSNSNDYRGSTHPKHRPSIGTGYPSRYNPTSRYGSSSRYGGSDDHDEGYSGDRDEQGSSSSRYGSSRHGSSSRRSTASGVSSSRYSGLGEEEDEGLSSRSRFAYPGSRRVSSRTLDEEEEDRKYSRTSTHRFRRSASPSPETQSSR